MPRSANDICHTLPGREPSLCFRISWTLSGSSVMAIASLIMASPSSLPTSFLLPTVAVEEPTLLMWYTGISIILVHRIQSLKKEYCSKSHGKTLNQNRHSGYQPLCRAANDDLIAQKSPRQNIYFTIVTEFRYFDNVMKITVLYFSKLQNSVKFCVFFVEVPPLAITRAETLAFSFCRLSARAAWSRPPSWKVSCYIVMKRNQLNVTNGMEYLM